MKKLISFFLLFLLLSLILPGAVSCGTAGEDSDILNAFRALAPKAKEMYEIVYNDKLPHALEEYSGYYQVLDGAAYTSIQELTDAMNRVFTGDYAKSLYHTAFNGVVSDLGNIPPKFSEKSGVLFVNPSVTAGFSAPREADLSGARVIKKNRYMAIVAVMMTDPVTKESEELEVTMKSVDGVWRIDSPLY